MKDSAAGPDEITAGMMRWACKIPKFRRHFCSAIRSLWVTSPCQWPEMLHQATIVSLWKRKGSPGDLIDHRGICLIPLWGRVLGRIVAARLARYAEQQRDSGHYTVGIQGSSFDSWGPGSGAQSPGRCHQALLFAGIGPVLCGTSGFEESLPELVSERLYTVMRHFGASEGILRVIQGLIQLTQYRCRAGKILSEPSLCSEDSRKVAQLPR